MSCGLLKLLLKQQQRKPPSQEWRHRSGGTGAWWHRPLIPSVGRGIIVSSKDHPDLYSEFWVNQGYIERICLKKINEWMNDLKKKKRGERERPLDAAILGTPGLQAHINPSFPKRADDWKSWDENQGKMGFEHTVFMLGSMFPTAYPTCLCYNLWVKEASIFTLVWQISKQNHTAPKVLHIQSWRPGNHNGQLGGSEQPHPPEQRPWDPSE